MQQTQSQVLKTDLFGSISKITRTSDHGIETVIVRDISCARWWTRPIARRLAAREAKVLRRLPVDPGLPALIEWNNFQLTRSFVEGAPMQSVKPTTVEYFKSAKTLLHQLHLNGVVHNDTAKEPNWLVRPDGTAGLVDFQLAAHFIKRSRFFRTLALEDIRHLLKHKRSYIADTLTTREIKVLATRSWHNRVWHSTGKKVYVFVTRRLLKWQDREGANDRQL